MEKEFALITGASSGIGMELARIMASEKINLIVVARRMERLQKLKLELEKKYPVRVIPLEQDLTVENAGHLLFEEVNRQKIRITYLINNAGFGGYGYFHERKWEKDKQMIQLNILALTELTRYFLPLMIKNRKGKILNIASSAAFIPGPLQAVYFATKSYVVSFSQAIHEEVRKKGVSCTAYCPTATQTEFIETGNLENTRLFRGKLMSAKKVAKEGYLAMQKRRRVKISSKSEAFAFRFILPLIPRSILLKFSGKLLEEVV